jgi:hypothetical protein
VPDPAVFLVESYLRLNGYFTVTEHPVVEAAKGGEHRTVTDLDVLAFRFPGAGRTLVAGRPESDPAAHLYAPDPELGVGGAEADMLIGEVKQGRAVLNRGAADPRVLRAALARFGCSSPEHAPRITDELLRRGGARLPAGHRVRLVAFGSAPGDPTGPPHQVVLLGHIVDFLTRFLHEHWDVLRHEDIKDPGLGFLLTLKKARRGFTVDEEGAG